jgi:hypothetical protein
MIDRFLNPDAYHSDAVASASSGDIVTLSPDFLIIRLCVELRKNNISAIQVILQRMRKLKYVGYQLFQVTTARMIIAFRQHNKAAFMLALEAWLDGRHATPQNWDNKVLEQAEFQDWLLEVDPAKLEEPKLVVAQLTKEDRAFVKNQDEIALKSVLENMEWLVPPDSNMKPEKIARSYKLASFNQHLREARFSSTEDFPDLILALDEAGNFLGSFISP